MSLLLDALKRAEEAKRAKLSVDSTLDVSLPDAKPSLEVERPVAEKVEPPRKAEPADFRLEDYKEVIPPRARQSASPTAKRADLNVDSSPTAAELSLLDFAEAKSANAASLSSGARTPESAPVQSASTRAAHAATSVEAVQSRDSARNVFVAKQTLAAETGTKKKWLLPVIAVALFAIGGGGWYVWNEVSRVSRPAAVNMAARPLTPLPAAAPGTGQVPRPPDANVPAKPESPVEAPLPPLLPPPAEMAPLPKLAVRAPVESGPRLTEREALAKSLKSAAAAKEVPLKLQLAKTIEIPSVNTDLLEAYEALKTGDYPRAKTLYAKLVSAEPLNPDAHLGLATVLARGGESAAAARSYRQVLVIDPRNGAAVAGLLAVSAARSPSPETELRTLVSQHPETASLRFSLGNLYASERRWVEAQQAYFDAYRLESDNADYLYNLAVSLDHLKQTALSRDYYQKALQTRPRSGGQFDPAVVARRIKELASEARID